MTVRELIALLQPHAEKNPDAQVCVTWEGTRSELQPDEVYTSFRGELVISGDGDRYKETIEKSHWPWQGE